MDKRGIELDKETLGFKKIGVIKDWRRDKKELTWIGGR